MCIRDSTPDELDYFLGNATPRVFLCDPAKAEALSPLANRHNAVLLTLDGAGQGTLPDLMRAQSDSFTPTDRSPADLAAILYTSGTTGRSKGAMLTHANLLSNAETLAKPVHLTETDVLLHALPILLTHGLFVAANISLLTGGAMIFLPLFEADTVLRLSLIHI